MRIVGTFVLILLGAAAFGVLLVAFGAGRDITLAEAGIIGLPGVILGLAGGMVNRPNGTPKNVARGGIDGAVLAFMAAFIGGVVVAIISLVQAADILGGVPADIGGALIRALLPSGAYLVIGLLLGVLGAGLRGMTRR